MVIKQSRIRKHYPGLFDDHALQTEAESVARRVFELTEFLVHVLKIKLEDLGKPINVSWHSSCHAKREMGIENEPKQLLQQLKNVTLVELEREDECCGFGGTFAVKEPHISAAMVKDKIEDIKTATLWKKKKSSFEPDFCAVKLQDNPWIVQPFEIYEEVRIEDLIKKYRK